MLISMEISALVVMLDAFDGGKRKYIYIYFLIDVFKVCVENN